MTTTTDRAAHGAAETDDGAEGGTFVEDDRALTEEETQAEAEAEQAVEAPPS